MADLRCERCGARTRPYARADLPIGEYCANRACGMCPDYRPAPTVDAETIKRIDELESAVSDIRGFLVL